MARQLARRQRRERLAGFALAALGVVVLVVALIALRQPSKTSTVAGSATSTPTKTASRSASRSASPTPSDTPSQSSAAPSTPPASASTSAGQTGGKLPLVVLNNTTVTGLAAQASDRFRAGGWTVTSFGNYQNDILSTCAYYDPAVPGAQAAAELLQTQFPAIKRVQPKFAELPAGPVVVVLTPDYS